MKSVRFLQLLAFVLATGVLPACGGRVDESEDDSAESDGTGGNNVGFSTNEAISSVCEEICSHIMDSCGGGKLDTCLEDCEAFDPASVSEDCIREYSAFLECMKTVDIDCEGAKIFTVGCDLERENYWRACRG